MKYNIHSMFGYISWRNVIFIAIILWLITTSNIFSTENEILKHRVSLDKTVYSVPLEVGSVEGVTDLLNQLQGTSVMSNVTALISNVSDVTPELILMGSSADEVEKILKLFHNILKETLKQKHIVAISATLKELSDSDIKNIGLNFKQSLSFNFKHDYVRKISGVPNNREINSTTVQALSRLAACLYLEDETTKGKTLVSSEIYTPNGVKGILSNTQTIVTTISDNEKISSPRNLETCIEVTPTVIDYKKEKLKESLLKLEVKVKFTVLVNVMSSVDGEQIPESITKEFTTTRILKANGQNIILGTFLTDSIIKNKSGIPLLSQLPLLKHLFSCDSTEKTRNLAVLTMSAKIIPDNLN